MSKSSRRRKRRNRKKIERPAVKPAISKPEPQSPSQPGTTALIHPVRFYHDRISSISKKLMAAILAVATLVGTGVVLAPQMSVDPPSVVTDPANPFNELFTITNKSYLSLYDVKVTCAEPSIGFNPTSAVPLSATQHLFSTAATVTVSVFSVPKLPHDDPRSFFCNSFSSFRSAGVPMNIVYCAVKVRVAFKLMGVIPWWPKSFPLEAYLDYHDGKLHWSHPVLTHDLPAKPK